MNKEKTTSEVRRIICGVLAIEEGTVAGPTPLRELPGVESIKVLRIITQIEARFAIELDEQIVFNIGTFGELVDEVAKLSAAAPSPAQAPLRAVN